VPGPENFPGTVTERNALTPEATVRYTFRYRTETHNYLTGRPARCARRETSRRLRALRPTHRRL